MITSNLYNHLTLVLEGSCQWRLRKRKKGSDSKWRKKITRGENLYPRVKDNFI